MKKIPSSLLVLASAAILSHAEDSPSVGLETNTLDEDAIRQACVLQEQILLQSPEARTEEQQATLQSLYAQDLQAYFEDSIGFLTSRSELCGGESGNFAALGRIVLGKYQEVQSIIEDDQQVRGWYLGRGALNRDRMPPNFLLAQSDAGTDTPAGREGTHAILRQSIIDKFIVPAQTNVRSDTVVRANLQDHVDVLVDSLARIDGGPKANLTATTSLIGDFVCRWALQAMFELDDVDQQIVETIKKLFLLPTGVIYQFWMEPMASAMNFDDGLQISQAFDQVVAFLEQSPVLSEYQPTPATLNLTKAEYAAEVAAVLPGAGLLGLQRFILNIFTVLAEHSEEALATDHASLGNALLEAARINPPVKNINVLLSQDTRFNINGIEKIVPTGTPIMASILLASYDAEAFEEPLRFNPMRANLRDQTVNFASIGYDDESEALPGRSCLGQHLSYKAGMDVLSTWLKRMDGTSSNSDANGHALAPSVDNGGRAIETYQCIQKFQALDFESDSLYLFDKYFREDSKFIYPAAGVYEGPKAIEEYVAFMSLVNPMFVDKQILDVDLTLKSVDQSSGICTFLVNLGTKFHTDPAYWRDVEYITVAMTKIVYEYQENYISEIDLFYTDEFMRFFMDKSEARSNFVCHTHASCANYTNEGQMPHAECMKRLDALPSYTENEWIDGNDYGCRALHATLARSDAELHCPHISFEPEEDPNGDIKCQKSKRLTAADFFDDQDMEEYRRYVAKFNAAVGAHLAVDADIGYKIISKPPESKTTTTIVAGIIIPISLFFAIFFGMRWVQPETGCMQSKNSRRLCIVGLVWIITLILAFALCGLVVWGVGKENPEWSDAWDDVHRFYPSFGKLATTSGTELQDSLSDEDFQVYTGFVIWITVLLAGVGLEALVWFYFVKAWSDCLETKWRFAQFLFPLLAMTSLGLSLFQNFLALPVLFLGLWKFGFPETLMFLYLGVFGSAQGKAGRCSDLLNGFGTAVHHAAAALIISMQLSGTIPPSRYVVGPILILVMQHWVVLLAYSNNALYSAIELVLEYFFEWAVLSNFQQLYYLHWTAALGGGSMLLGHWLYLSAAFLSLFANNHEEGSGEKAVHVRGVELMATSGQSGDMSATDQSEQTGGRRTSVLSRRRGRNSTAMDLAHNFLAQRQKEPPGLGYFEEEEVDCFTKDGQDEEECASLTAHSKDCNDTANSEIGGLDGGSAGEEETSSHRNHEGNSRNDGTKASKFCIPEGSHHH